MGVGSSLATPRRPLQRGRCHTDTSDTTASHRFLRTRGVTKAASLSARNVPPVSPSQDRIWSEVKRCSGRHGRQGGRMQHRCNTWQSRPCSCGARGVPLCTGVRVVALSVSRDDSGLLRHPLVAGPASPAGWPAGLVCVPHTSLHSAAAPHQAARRAPRALRAPHHALCATRPATPPLARAEYTIAPPQRMFREFTPSWFSACMGTGAVAIAIGNFPWAFPGAARTAALPAGAAQSAVAVAAAAPPAPAP